MRRHQLSSKAGAWVESMLQANTIPDITLALQSAGLRQQLRMLPLCWSTPASGFQPQVLESHYVRWRLAHSTPFDMAALAASLCRSSLLLHVGLVCVGPSSGSAALMATLELVLLMLQLAMLLVRRDGLCYYWLQRKMLTGVIAVVSCVLLATDGMACPFTQSLAAVWKVAFVQRYIMPHGQVRGTRACRHMHHTRQAQLLCCLACCPVAECWVGHCMSRVHGLVSVLVCTSVSC